MIYNYLEIFQNPVFYQLNFLTKKVEKKQKIKEF